MGSHHVARIDPDLDPTAIVVNIPHIDIVVADHRARPRGACHHDLVGSDRNAVLDKHLRCSSGKAYCVAASARLNPSSVVDVKLSELDTERTINGETFSAPHGV